MSKCRTIKFLPKDATYADMDSPVGKLTIITSTKGLHAVLWDHEHEAFKTILNTLFRSENDPVYMLTKGQLNDYFRGKRKIFDLPLLYHGTDFQIQAWKQLIRIPYAKTITYAEQAERVGNKNKARAVGLANGFNPIPIIIPCHRVIGSNGHLVGFAGGIEKKSLLIKLEQENL